MKQEFLNKSIIIAAHPDDEILWFSSLLEKTKKIVLAFHKVNGDKAMTRSRDRVLSDYPLHNLFSLNIDEAGVFSSKHFRFPIQSKYGLKIFHPKKEKRYKANYFRLVSRLEKILPDYTTVFTHNPWGEYGHEEHIQIYRAVKELQKTYKFDIFFNNYASNRTIALAYKHIGHHQSSWIRCQTDPGLAQTIKKLYMDHNCWTWSDTYKWFNDEIWIQDKIHNNPTVPFQHITPLNVIKL